ncbi:MAG: DUF885 domain-containing protein, partial [Chloroflexota bacterium]|nr:DUF885 domain-containing protein [Chloroflexota bacterium]
MTTESFEPLVEDTRPLPATAFERAFHAFLDEYFEAYPVWATSIGYHLVDHRWDDFSESGRLARLAMVDRHELSFRDMAEDDLSEDERIDRGILLELLDHLRFDEDVLREASWDPLAYIYVSGSGLFGLLAREYAPWSHRGNAFLHRVRGLAQVFQEARQSLIGLPDRPVSLLHLETALAQLSGVGELIDQGMAEAQRRAAAGEEPQLPVALEEAAGSAREALAGFRQSLDTEVRARAQGDGRLGPELFQQKLHQTLSSDLGHQELRDRARRDYELVRAEMVRLSRQLWPVWKPDEELPQATDATDDVDSRIVRGVLDAVAEEHRQPDELLEWCQREVARIEDFCRQRSLIGLPDEALRVTWTPVFMRAYGRAFLDSPGPLDKGQSSYFWITPPDESGPPEDVESYLREDNDRMLRLLCIHEGVPGHYLQLAWSNRSPSLVRSIFSNGMFAEGWAVYVT